MCFRSSVALRHDPPPPPPGTQVTVTVTYVHRSRRALLEVVKSPQQTYHTSPKGNDIIENLYSFGRYPRCPSHTTGRYPRCPSHTTVDTRAVHYTLRSVPALSITHYGRHPRCPLHTTVGTRTVHYTPKTLNGQIRHISDTPPEGRLGGSFVA